MSRKRARPHQVGEAKQNETEVGGADLALRIVEVAECESRSARPEKSGTGGNERLFVWKPSGIWMVEMKGYFKR